LPFKFNPQRYNVHSPTMATLGAKWMSAMSGVVYPSAISCFLISAHALASCMPCTVMRTISAPASAHFFTCFGGNVGKV
jgi:hypothetical protein